MADKSAYLPPVRLMQGGAEARLKMNYARMRIKGWTLKNAFSEAPPQVENNSGLDKDRARPYVINCMRIYWSLKSVPELQALPRKERRRVHEECLRKHFFRAPATCRSITAFLARILISAFGMFICISVSGSFGMKPNFWVFLTSAFIVLPIGSFIFSLIAIPVLRPFYLGIIEKRASVES